MKSAIRKHLRDFLAIIALVVIAAITGSYILVHQNLYLPGWVPLVGQDNFILKGEFATAQAITPGQGQTVDIAGVQVGEISKVELKDGRAIVTMRVDPRYDEIYSNARMLLRPKTGLKDMIVELDPGSPRGGTRIKSGGTIPVANTQPDVNFDEILASLDSDTRGYLQLLLNGAATGLRGNGRELAQVWRRFDPTARFAEEATRLLIARNKNIQRSITNFGEFTRALSQSDSQLAEFVDSSAAVFRRFAAQSQALQETIAEAPATLQTTQTALRKATTFANTAGPTLEALRPFARNLGPALKAARPFLIETTPIFRDQLGPFTVAATPVVKQLRPVARQLAAATPDLQQGFSIFNRFFNALAYNPPGRAEGYFFYLTWLGHLANSALSSQDAMGSYLRAAIYLNCNNITTFRGVKRNGVPGTDTEGSAPLALITQLAYLPETSEFCN